MFNKDIKRWLVNITNKVAAYILSICVVGWIALLQMKVPENYLILSLILVVASSFVNIFFYNNNYFLGISFCLVVALSVFFSFFFLHVSILRSLATAIFVFLAEAVSKQSFPTAKAKQKETFSSVVANGTVMPISLGMVVYCFTVIFL
jgi:hypothetical protein